MNVGELVNGAQNGSNPQRYEFRIRKGMHQIQHQPKHHPTRMLWWLFWSFFGWSIFYLRPYLYLLSSIFHGMWARFAFLLISIRHSDQCVRRCSMSRTNDGMSSNKHLKLMNHLQVKTFTPQKINMSPKEVPFQQKVSSSLISRAIG